jgi:predicted dehydrogenase
LTSEKLRVAVIGLGKMGLVHSCILSVLPDVQIVALCEKSGLIRRFAKKLLKGVQIIDDARKLAECNLDAIYITTPIPSHFAVARILYSNEIVRNVFVEKTLAQNFEQAAELTRMAEKSGGVNMVGYLRRFYVTFQKAKDLLSQKAIGIPSSFQAYAYSADFCNVKDTSQVLASRGGVLRDLGCYAIDLSLWFFGELSVSKVGASQNDSRQNSSVDFEVQNSSGLAGQFEVSPYMHDYRMPEVGFLIRGTDGEIVVKDDMVELRSTRMKSSVWYRHDLQDNVPFWLGLPEYYREDSHFVKSILDGHAARPDFASASNVDRIIGEIEARE